MDERLAPPRGAFPHEPVARQWKIRADSSLLSNHFALASADEALTSTFALRRRQNDAGVDGLHTVAVTERDRLAALARAAGLRLSPADLDHLLPAWKRYVALVEGIREAIPPEVDQS
jgi:hypothetical protein